TSSQQIAQLRGAILRLCAVAQPTRGRGNDLAWWHLEAISAVIANAERDRYEGKVANQELLNELLVEVTVPLQPRVVAAYLWRRLYGIPGNHYDKSAYPDHAKRLDRRLVKAFLYLEELDRSSGRAM